MVEPSHGQNAGEQHDHCEDQYEHASTRTDPGVADCELPHTDGAYRSVLGSANGERRPEPPVEQVVGYPPFSCDIAYSRSPTASRASRASVNT